MMMMMMMVWITIRMKMMGSANEKWMMKDERAECASDDDDRYDNDDE